MAQQKHMGSDDDQQSIEHLQRRYEALNTRRIQAETQRQNAADRLKELKAEAKTKYGTDDLEQLRQKLAEMEAENEAKRATYQADLDKIEADLAHVESKFARTDQEQNDDRSNV